MPLAHLARLREATYRLFSQTFLYPDEDRVRSTVALASRLAEEKTDWTRFAFFAAWSRLLSSLKDFDPKDAREIEGDFVSLFVANSAGVPCPPCESVYREPAGRPSGWLLAEVESEYAAAGFALSPTLGELPDHVAVEMEFMALLCGREAQAWEERNPTRGIRALRKQKAFLDRHLALWFPEFVRQVTAVDGGGTYAAVGEAAQAFVCHDRDLLETLLEALPAGGRGVTEASV
jgi:TorA maturation chaperone TorD